MAQMFQGGGITGNGGQLIDDAGRKWQSLGQSLGEIGTMWMQRQQLAIERQNAATAELNSKTDQERARMEKARDAVARWQAMEKSLDAEAAAAGFVNTQQYLLMSPLARSRKEQIERERLKLTDDGTMDLGLWTQQLLADATAQSAVTPQTAAALAMQMQTQGTLPGMTPGAVGPAPAVPGPQTSGSPAPQRSAAPVPGAATAPGVSPVSQPATLMDLQAGPRDVSYDLSYDPSTGRMYNPENLSGASGASFRDATSNFTRQPAPTQPVTAAAPARTPTAKEQLAARWNVPVTELDKSVATLYQDSQRTTNAKRFLDDAVKQAAKKKQDVGQYLQEAVVAGQGISLGKTAADALLLYTDRLDQPKTKEPTFHNGKTTSFVGSMFQVGENLEGAGPAIGSMQTQTPATALEQVAANAPQQGGRRPVLNVPETGTTPETSAAPATQLTARERIRQASTFQANPKQEQQRATDLNAIGTAVERSSNGETLPYKDRAAAINGAKREANWAEKLLKDYAAGNPEAAKFVKAQKDFINKSTAEELEAAGMSNVAARRAATLLNESNMRLLMMESLAKSDTAAAKQAEEFQLSLEKSISGINNLLGTIATAAKGQSLDKYLAQDRTMEQALQVQLGILGGLLGGVNLSTFRLEDTPGLVGVLQRALPGGATGRTTTAAPALFGVSGQTDAVAPNQAELDAQYAAMLEQ